MKSKIALAITVSAGIALLAYLAAGSRGGRTTVRAADEVIFPENFSAFSPAPGSSTRPNARLEPMASVFLSPIIAMLGEECLSTPERSRVLGLSARLKKRVHAMPPDQAAAALAELLRSGLDYKTGLGFAVGPEGVMDETPTLRTMLLDLLGQTDPKISAEVSREILGATNSADEYALALRNLAWGNHDRQLDPELLGWLRGMLGRPQWMAGPSDGFLEAFDAAVDLGAAEEMAKVLASTSRIPSSPVERAAFIALDRIMLTDSGEVLKLVERNASFLASNPMHRASLFSRLDVRDPRQRQALSQYLLGNEQLPGELEYFSRVYPNGNRFVGYRLITAQEPVPSIKNIEALDKATLALMETWAGDPAFSSRVGELRDIASRLRTGRPTGL